MPKPVLDYGNRSVATRRETHLRGWLFGGFAIGLLALTAFAATRLEYRVLARISRQANVRASYTFIVTPWPDQLCVELEGEGEGRDPHQMSSVRLMVDRSIRGDFSTRSIAILKEPAPPSTRPAGTTLITTSMLPDWLRQKLAAAGELKPDEEVQVIATVAGQLTRGQTPSALTSQPFVGTSESYAVLPRITAASVRLYYTAWLVAWALVTGIVWRVIVRKPGAREEMGPDDAPNAPRGRAR